MSKRKRNIELGLKEKILSESDEVGCVITELAAKYEVAVGMIYAWRSDRNKVKHRSEASGGNFVELLSDEKEQISVAPSIDPEHIEAELKFADFRFTIAGKVSQQKFKDIIELLSASC